MIILLVLSMILSRTFEIPQTQNRMLNVKSRKSSQNSTSSKTHVRKFLQSPNSFYWRTLLGTIKLIPFSPLETYQLKCSVQSIPLHCPTIWYFPDTIMLKSITVIITNKADYYTNIIFLCCIIILYHYLC